MFWSEFSTTLKCLPDEELTNVLLPATILLSIENGTLSYPPPPPPPPRTESPPPPPSPPPGSDFQCYFPAVPQTTNTHEHIPCFLWCAAAPDAPQASR